MRTEEADAVRGKRAGLAALLLAALALLGGCMGGLEERPLVDLSEVEIDLGVDAPEHDAWADGTTLATLYFLDEQGERLVPVTRRIDVPGGMSLPQAALRALLAGPAEGEDASWPELGDVEDEAWAEFSGDVATVNLPARARALSPQALYAVRLAIAGTLTEFSGVSYVNVLVGGREEGLDLGATLPVGALSRVQDLDVTAQYGRLEGRGEGGLTRLTALFFPAEGGAHVLATVRSVAYAQATGIDYLYTLLAELGKGADHPLAAAAYPAPMDYIVEMPDIVRAWDGASRAIELRFSAELNGALEAAGLTRGVYLAALADTLLGFVPAVDGLQATIGDERVEALSAGQTPDGEALAFEQGLITRAAVARYTGSPVTLYALDGEDADRLAPVQRALAQDRRLDPRALLCGLMALGDAGALPAGLTEADILAVEVRDGEALVHLSGAFADALAKGTPERERAAVYAMVNTLTEDARVRSVAFFFDGEQVETLAGGLEMRGRFLRNPGMVVR